MKRARLISGVAAFLIAAGGLSAYAVNNWGETWFFGGYTADPVHGTSIKNDGIHTPNIFAAAVSPDTFAYGGGYGATGGSGDSSGNLSINGSFIADGAIQSGKSGTQGSLRAYPSTSASGYFRIIKADNAADDITTLTIGAMAGARNYSILDTGTSTATVVMTEGAQTINGQKTFVAPILGTPASGTLSNCAAFTGDSGSGGVRGLVPAPASGDAAANKFLKASGAWATAGSGDASGPSSATDNAIARFDGTTGKLIQNSVVTIADSTGLIEGASGIIMKSNASTAAEFHSFLNGTGTHGLLNFYSASGTQSSPTVSEVGAAIMTIGGSGYNGATYGTGSGAIILQVADTITGTQVPGAFHFYTTNADGPLSDAFQIDENGNARATNFIGGQGALLSSESGGALLMQSGATGNTLIAQASQDSIATPDTSTDADPLLFIAAQGHDGTLYKTAAGISIDVNGTPATGFVPGAVTVFASDNSTGNTNVARFEHDAAIVYKPTSITGDLTLTTAGNGLLIKTGSNATAGKATMVGGTVVVSTTKVTANSLILLTAQNNAGVLGSVSVSARTAGTSFTITSTNALDTSDVAWFIVEPA